VRRLLIPILVLLALIAAGCGSSDSGSSLSAELKYVPKDAPLVIAFDVDRDGKQWKQVNELIGKFPFGGQVKGQFKTAFDQRSGLDYDKDLKPLLTGDVALAITAAPQGGGDPPFIVAWKVKDSNAALRLVKTGATKSGSVDDTDVYRSKSGAGYAAVKDSTILAASTQDEIAAAFKRADGEHLSEGDFESSLGDLPKDSLMRMTGDLQALLASSPNAAAARKIKWLAALRTFGFVVTAEKDGLSLAFDVKTDSSGLSAADLPLAEGDAAPPVVRRAGEVGFAVRDLAQSVKFGEAAAQVTDAAGYAKYQRDKAKLGKQLGVDVDRDLIGQLTGNTTFSVSLDGQVAARADLRDPAAAEATLKKIAPKLVKLSKGKSVGLSTPKNGKGFYALAQANGDKVVFGVVGKSFVLASDAARAAQFAGQSPSLVPGAKGAAVVASDARALANAIAQKQGQGTAAQIVTGALGDLVGSAKATTSNLSGKLKLEIK
jgi:hypothetical protein